AGERAVAEHPPGGERERVGEDVGGGDRDEAAQVAVAAELGAEGGPGGAPEHPYAVDGADGEPPREHGAPDAVAAARRQVAAIEPAVDLAGHVLLAGRA